MDFFALMLGTVPAMLLVYLIVEGLKTYEFVSEDSRLSAPQAAMTTGLVLTVVALVREFVPAAAPFIDIAAPILAGGLIAGLFYDIAGDGLRDRVAQIVAAILVPNQE